jgi:hypothetical protein
LPKIDAEAKPQPREPRTELPRPARSEAVTLLAALQREARLVDLIMQPLGQFTDEQIGAAARNVLTDSRGVLERFFALQPVVNQEEGTSYAVPAGYDPARLKIAGEGTSRGLLQGRLVHQGWQATSVKLPAWTGSSDSALVIAPAEIELTASLPATAHLVTGHQPPPAPAP